VRRARRNCAGTLCERQLAHVDIVVIEIEHRRMKPRGEPARELRFTAQEGPAIPIRCGRAAMTASPGQARGAVCEAPARTGGGGGADNGRSRASRRPVPACDAIQPSAASIVFFAW